MYTYICPYTLYLSRNNMLLSSSPYGYVNTKLRCSTFLWIFICRELATKIRGPHVKCQVSVFNELTFGRIASMFVAENASYDASAKGIKALGSRGAGQAKALWKDNAPKNIAEYQVC